MKREDCIMEEVAGWKHQTRIIEAIVCMRVVPTTQRQSMSLSGQSEAVK